MRLVFSVPVYALCSFPSLLFPAAAPYIAAVRDCYEAWIIYNFMALCLAYVGGAGAPWFCCGRGEAVVRQFILNK